MYKDRYWKLSVFEGLDAVRAACDAAGVTMADASLRWLSHHSKLRPDLGDAVIVGGSSAAQLEAARVGLLGGPLPRAIVDAFDIAWAACKADAAPYQRGHSLYA